MLEWMWPWSVLLLPLPWFARRLLPAYKTRYAAIRVPFYTELESSSEPVAGSGVVRWLLCILMWVGLVAAIARPIWYGEPVSTVTSGRDLMLAIDISDSMRIDDMIIDGENVMRVDVVKAIAADFISNRNSDRIGLILFGQQAYLQTPLTFDHATVVSELEEALPGFAGSSTAIGDAMGLAISLLRDRPAESRVLVLLSDGSNTYGSEPRSATQVAAEANIKIHAIGLGADTHTGKDVIGQEIEINPSRDLDEQVLADIASDTGGRYFRARSVEDLAAIYANIDRLEPAPAEEFVRPQRSLYHWPLAVALVCALMLIITRPDL